MSQLIIMPIDGHVHVQLFTPLPSKVLCHWLISTMDIKDLAELRVIWKKINETTWYYIDFILLRNDVPEQREAVFLELFSMVFAREHLPFRGDGTEPEKEGEFRRCGSVSNRGQIPTVAELREFLQMLRFMRLLQERSDQCAREYENLSTPPTISLISGLAKKYDFEGGSWILYSPTKKRNGSDREGKPTYLYLSNEERRKSSVRTLTGILQELMAKPNPPPPFVWRIMWTIYPDETTNYVIKVSNKKTTYFDNRSREREPQGELSLYGRDGEVRELYQILDGPAIRPQKIKYKPEIMTVCRVNRQLEPLLDEVQKCLNIYTSLDRFDRSGRPPVKHANRP